MTQLATQVPIITIIPLLTAIGDRQWEKFQQLEQVFVSQYGVEVWQEVFNFRLKPALDKESDRWLRVQWCSEGYTVQNIVPTND